MMTRHTLSLENIVKFTTGTKQVKGQETMTSLSQ